MSTATVAAGAELTITGENFLPGSIATFTLHSDPVELGTVTVADDGTATLTTRLPSIVPAGAHTVVISGTDTSGESVEVGLALVVTAAGNSTSTATSSVSATATSSGSAIDKAAVSTPKNDLANTGASATLSLLVVMALLLGVGASVLLIGRRGKRA